MFFRFPTWFESNPPITIWNLIVFYCSWYILLLNSYSLNANCNESFVAYILRLCKNKANFWQIPNCINHLYLKVCVVGSVQGWLQMLFRVCSQYRRPVVNTVLLVQKIRLSTFMAPWPRKNVKYKYKKTFSQTANSRRIMIGMLFFIFLINN